MTFVFFVLSSRLGTDAAAQAAPLGRSGLFAELDLVFTTFAITRTYANLANKAEHSRLRCLRGITGGVLHRYLQEMRRFRIRDGQARRWEHDEFAERMENTGAIPLQTTRPLSRKDRRAILPVRAPPASDQAARGMKASSRGHPSVQVGW